MSGSDVKESTGVIVAVSDVHLAEKANLKSKQDDNYFLEFIRWIASNQLKEGGDLVLLGDTFEFWRRHRDNTVIESRGAINALQKLQMKNNVKIHCIIGNHDYNLVENNPFSIRFDTCSEHVVLRNHEKDYFFIHGHQLEIMYYTKYLARDYRCGAYKELLELSKMIYRLLYLSSEEAGQKLGDLWDSSEEIKRIITLKQLLDLKTFLEVDPNEKIAGFNGLEGIIHNDYECVCNNIKGCKTQMNMCDVVVFGHIHKQSSDMGKRIVSVGSWSKRPDIDYNYLEIDKYGNISLNIYSSKYDMDYSDSKWEIDNNDDDTDDD